MLLSKLAQFTNLALTIEFWQAKNDLFRLHILKPWKVDLVEPFVWLGNV